MYFLHCDLGLSGKALAGTVLGGLIILGLGLRNCPGQGYDRVAVVYGHLNGFSVHICKINSKAIYTHCHSHRLNLVIGASCNIQWIRNVFTEIKEVSYFFKFSEPEQKMLINSIIKHAPDSQKKKVIWFLSYSIGWKRNRIGWFWRPFCSNYIFVLRKWVWIRGMYEIKLHQPSLLHLINY